MPASGPRRDAKGALGAAVPRSPSRGDGQRWKPERPVAKSLWLLPSGPDQVGDDHVRPTSARVYGGAGPSDQALALPAIANIPAHPDTMAVAPLVRTHPAGAIAVAVILAIRIAVGTIMSALAIMMTAIMAAIRLVPAVVAVTRCRVG